MPTPSSPSGLPADEPVERRKHRKTDKILVGLAAATGIIAILALVTTVVLARVEIVQNRHDSCVLLRKVVILATPPQDSVKGQEFLLTTPLADCDKYAGGFLP